MDEVLELAKDGMEEAIERLRKRHADTLLLDHLAELRGHRFRGLAPDDRQAFRQRQLHSSFIPLVRRLFCRISFIILRQSRRPHIIRTAPKMDLGVTIFLCCFLLVQALERAVVTFIQMIIFYHGNPCQIQFIKNSISSMDCPL